MMHLRTSLPLLLLTLTVSFAGAQTWPHDESDLKPDPKVRWGRLDNGVRYAIMPHTEPPGRLSLRLLVTAGSLNETEEQRGIAHFLEHMAFNGTQHFAADEMVEYFQRLGMAFGADTNAHTTYDEVVYKLELPRTDEALLNDALKLLRDYADGMLLLAEELDKERGVILAEKRSRDDVRYRTYLARTTFMLPDSLVPRRHPIGIEDVISNAPRERFVEFYGNCYAAGNLVVVAVGDIATGDVVSRIAKAFGDMKPRPASPPVDLGKGTWDGVHAMLHTEKESPTVGITIRSNQSFSPCPDTSAYRKNDHIRYAANRMIARRLEVIAKKEDAPFIGGSAYAYDWLDFVCVSAINATCRPEQWQPALTAIEQELRRALEHGFSDVEVDEIRANLLEHYENQVKKAATRKSRALANDLTSAISDDNVFTSPETDLEEASKYLADLTPETALAALRTAWATPARRIFVTGNLELPEAKEMILATYNASAETPVAPPPKVEKTDFAYAGFGTPGAVVSRERIDDLDITQLTLSNNVRVNIKKTDFQADTIHVLFRFGVGKLGLPEDKPGLAVLAGRCYTQGGLGAHSEDDLKRILAGKTVGAGFGVGDDAFTLGGATRRADLDLQLRLMTAYLTDPGYREEALRLARKTYRNQWEASQHTVQGTMQDRVGKFLAGGDFRFGMVLPDDFDKRTLDEVAAWIEHPRMKAAMDVSIVGDFDPDAIEAILLKTVGALPKRETDVPVMKDRRLIAFPEDVKARTFEYETQIPKALVSVCWKTTDIWNIARTRRLSVLANVLDDRLRVKIREELGDAYSPGAFSNCSDVYTGYGYIGTYVIADPEKAEGLTTTIRELVTDLHRRTITQDELTRALEPTLKSLEEWVRNNQYWLNNVLSECRQHPERLDWARSMQKDFKSVTTDEIAALAREYLDSDGLAVVIKPEAPSKAAGE